MTSPVTVTTQEVVQYAATDAGFRVWAKGIHDALVASGLTVSYTGIDFNTVTMPTTASTVAGSVVYEMNDSLSGTYPLYIKIGYGRGNTTNTNYGYRIDVQIGTTHNGSGTVAGVTQSTFAQGCQASTTDGQIIVCRQASGFTLFSHFTYNFQAQLVLTVERVHYNNTPTADGAVAVLTWVNANSLNTTSGESYSIWFNRLNATAYGPSVCMSMPPGLFGYSQNNSYDNYAPLARFQTYGKYDPLRTCFVSSRSQVGVTNSTFQGTVNGESARFRTPYGVNSASTSNVIFAVRTE